MPKVVAFMPMRHSSERVPGKNYRDLDGAPLFHHMLRTLEAVPDVDQILIDTDSPRLFDMTYTLAADAYLGDASSQIYEFLARPRPSFFIDARRDVKAEDDEWHLFWECGPVVRSVGELTGLLPEMETIGESYRARQEELFAYTIDLGDRPASERAANAILEAISLREDR